MSNDISQNSFAAKYFQIILPYPINYPLLPKNISPPFHKSSIENVHLSQAGVLTVIFIIIVNKYLLRTYFVLEIQIKSNFCFPFN